MMNQLMIYHSPFNDSPLIIHHSPSHKMPFNSKVYSFSNVSVNILGRNVRGLLGVKYTVKTDKAYLRGRGNKPLSIQSGDKSYEGELQLTQSEIEAMVLAVKSQDVNADLTDVAFDIVVSYGEGTRVVTDIVLGAEFTDYEKGFKQGDKHMEVSLKFMALDLKEGA